MWDHMLIYLFIFYNVGIAECAYPPIGDEVQAGSVLLPASRRGRYLANIARRQAVDGTGIKFNKDADRMNAEAKKKVDVLSEELLPYIIAEQERRTTLYKRVMTAIQNGEKGVTIAEIRNKPPAIIRKGLMYRCPTNRAPREPDGSGVVICEDNLKPTPIMFESCLSAEDKELYVAENKYFFCNRHKVEGPDLPRNGTTVIGCAPCERTPLNYTSQKCALEDTDDVVVHYRYYPDRTYKFVSELDPEREVCDHWNPCQIGYIFSLPGPDQATPASELWPVAVDTINETVPEDKDDIVVPDHKDHTNETAESDAYNYTTSARYVRIPDGYEFHGVGKYVGSSLSRIMAVDEKGSRFSNIKTGYQIMGKYVKVWLTFHPLTPADYTSYYVRFVIIGNKEEHKYDTFLYIRPGQMHLTPELLYVLPGQPLNLTRVPYSCQQCALEGVILRAADGTARGLERTKYRIRDSHDNHMVIEFELGSARARDFGDYFLIMPNGDGSEERIKALTVKVISNEPLYVELPVGGSLELSPRYECKRCQLQDVLCRGASALASGRAVHLPARKTVTINLLRFEDTDACVYVGTFQADEVRFRRILAVLEKVELVGAKPLRVTPPPELTPFETTIKYKCARPDCRLINVTVNGLPLETTTRRTIVGSVAYYLPGESSVTIGITEYSSLYAGVYQGVFALGAEQVTKTLMAIGS